MKLADTIKLTDDENKVVKDAFERVHSLQMEIENLSLAVHRQGQTMWKTLEKDFNLDLKNYRYSYDNDKRAIVMTGYVSKD